MSEFERSQLRVSENQEELMAQQEKLKSSQQNVQVFVAENLKELTVEKALIAAGQRELARMTDSIRKKLGMSSHRSQYLVVCYDIQRVPEKKIYSVCFTARTNCVLQNAIFYPNVAFVVRTDAKVSELTAILFISCK